MNQPINENKQQKLNIKNTNPRADQLDNTNKNKVKDTLKKKTWRHNQKKRKL